MIPRLSSYHGILPINKRAGMTSHDVVDAVRRILKQRAVGHAGTLDPAAEGLLVVLLGKATKVAPFVTGERKRYEAEITLGRESGTYDAEGVDLDIPAKMIPMISAGDLEKTLDEFRGPIRQQVPAFSAVRVDGERLYKRARKGEETERPIRDITIHSLRVIQFHGAALKIDVECSSGTFIRSLAHDLGARLGCGGYLSHLSRTASGHLTIKDALTLEQLESSQQAGEAAAHVMAIDRALGFSAVTVTDDFRAGVHHGRRPAAADILRTSGAFAAGDRLVVMDPAGVVMAVGVAQISSGQLGSAGRQEVLKYDRVLA